MSDPTTSTPSTTPGPAPAVVSLREAAHADVGLVGAKARQLGRLIEAGYDVPAGFVVPSSVTELGAIRLDFAAAFRALDGPVAVRSSAVAEDRDHASYAGQYTTVLDVRDLDAALAAVETCWRSACADAAAAYRRDHGDTDDRMAVIVQRMVPARVAGVAFSADPVSGADRVVIEAVAGLGDAFMDGSVTPERWHVAPGVDPVRVDALDEVVLTTSDAITVSSACVGIAADLGVPVDIEWAFDAGRLCVLQARPITALPVEPVNDVPKGQTWLRSDAYFPRPITPLSYDAWLPHHTAAFEYVTSRFGLPFDGVDHRHWYGRVYDRLLPVGGVAKDHPLPPKLVLKLAMRLVPSMRTRLAVAARAAADDLPMQVIDAWEHGGRQELRGRTRELLAVDRSALSETALADHLDDVTAHVRQAAISHFMLSFAGTFILAGQLGLLMEELLGWAPERVVDLIQGHGTASTAMGTALDELAAAVREGPASRAELVAAFADRHGHRVLGGDLRQPTWAEDPSVIDAMVGARLDAPAMIGRAASADTADATEAEALLAITDTTDRARFLTALERARRGRPYGDETEADALEVPAIVRYIALEAGRRLAASGVLRTVDEVFFLTTAELAAALRGGDVPHSDLERRLGEHRWALANDAPDVIGTRHDGIPTADVLPVASRPIAGAALWSVALFEADAAPAAEVGAEGSYAGVAASPGQATGPARVIADPSEFHRVERGDILVCHHTMAAWSPVFALVAGLVTEHGGPLSHPGTLAREYGIPAVLAVAGATSQIDDGAIITVDGSRGVVTIAG